MKPLFLVGYMAAGKTTLGRRAAQLLNVEFIDLDAYIEYRYRKRVSDLFAERGEEGFRDIERRMLHEVAEFDNVLVATGGGTPCFFDNMELFGSFCTDVVQTLVPCKSKTPVGGG